jgi:hypothetical protein
MKKISAGIKIGLLLLSGLLILSASCKKDFKKEEQSIDI